MVKRQVGRGGRISRRLGGCAFAITLVVCGSTRAAFRVNGDSDADGDLDLADLLAFQACYGGSDVEAEAECTAFDFDDDDDVDLADWMSFQAAYTGPAYPQTEFTSADPDFAGFFGGGPSRRGGPEDDAAAGREIEEADIVRTSGGFLYLLNTYRGLTIIDIRDPDRPVIVGRLSLFGTPVEMYFRDATIYAVVNQNRSVPWPIGDAEPPGSRILVIDAGDPTQPALRATFALQGEVRATRRVGDVIYAVSYRAAWWYDPTSTEATDETYIISLNIADPGNVHAVEQHSFGSGALDMHVTTEAVFVAGSRYAWPAPPHTHLQYIDISDPQGRIQIRGEFRVPGVIQNRFYMDAMGDAFRIVTQEWVYDERRRFQGTEVALHTFSLADPDAIVPLARLLLVRDESLRAVRFDGLRGYAVTYFQIDPLWVLDLTDPSAPQILGELEVPGWSTHIEPRGDRLVAVGIDDTDGRRPAVSLYDVSLSGERPKPTEINRILVASDSRWAWSLANSDEKAFSVLDEANLIVLPFSYWDEARRTHVDAVQLIDYDADRLTARAIVTHHGNVNRSRVEQDRLWLTSELAFQVINVDNRDRPQPTAMLELAADVIEAVPFGELAVELVRTVDDWRVAEQDGANVELRTTPRGAPNAMPPLDAVAARVFDGQLFLRGSTAWVVGAANPYDKRFMRLVEVDLTDPSALTIVHDLELDVQFPFNASFGPIFFGRPADGFRRPAPWISVGEVWYDPGQNPVLVGDSTLAVVEPVTFVWDQEEQVGHTEPARVAVVDLDGEEGPELVSRIELGEIHPIGMFARDGVVYFTTRETVRSEDGQFGLVRHLLHRIDVAVPAEAIVHDPVNVPGVTLDRDSRWLYTLDSQWTDEGTLAASLNVLQLFDDRALLHNSFPVGENIHQARMRDGLVYLIAQQVWYPWFGPIGAPAEDGAPVPSGTQFTLSVIDARNVGTLRESFRETTPGFANLRGLNNARLVVEDSLAGTLRAYDLVDPAVPSWIDAFTLSAPYLTRTQIDATTVFATSGLFGVQVIETGP